MKHSIHVQPLFFKSNEVSAVIMPKSPICYTESR